MKAHLEQLVSELKSANEVERSPWTVGSAGHVYGLELRNLDELKEMAGRLDIEGRSELSREQLPAAIEEELYAAPRGRADVVAFNRNLRDARHATGRRKIARNEPGRQKSTRKKAA